MKKSSHRAIAAAALFLASSSGFAASDSATLSVTASVAAVCKLTLSGPMAFGALDTTLSTNKTASATATYKCTKGSVVSAFKVNNTITGTYSGTMAGTGTNTDTIAYGITWTNPAVYNGVGMGAGVTAGSVTLSGTVLNADYVDVTPDSYTGSVGIAINY